MLLASQYDIKSWDFSFKQEIMITAEGLHFHLEKTECWKSASDPQFPSVLEAI